MTLDEEAGESRKGVGAMPPDESQAAMTYVVDSRGSRLLSALIQVRRYRPPDRSWRGL
jgi:hypothetical protein